MPVAPLLSLSRASNPAPSLRNTERTANKGRQKSSSDERWLAATGSRVYYINTVLMAIHFGQNIEILVELFITSEVQLAGKHQSLTGFIHKTQVQSNTWPRPYL
jgi:hypothetical protein